MREFQLFHIHRRTGPTQKQKAQATGNKFKEGNRARDKNGGVASWKDKKRVRKLVANHGFM